MKRRPATRCVAYSAGRDRRTGERLPRALACVPPETADTLAGDPDAMLVEHGDWENEAQCQERCNELALLPLPERAQLAERMPLEALVALAGTSRAVGAEAARALRNERGARDALLAQYTRFYDQVDLDSIDPPCDDFALPCIRPYQELLGRLRHTLPVPLTPTLVDPPAEDQAGGGYVTLRYPPIAGSRLAVVAPDFVGRRDAPAARELPDARDVPVLLPGETVVIAEATVPTPLVGLPYYWNPDVLTFGATPERLLAIGSELLPTRYPGDPDDEELLENSGIRVEYVAALPAHVDREAFLGVRGDRARRHAMAEYLHALERGLDLPHGTITRIGGLQEGFRISNVHLLASALARTGLPVHSMAVSLHVRTAGAH